VRVDKRLYELLKRDAKVADRSISQWVRYLLLEYYRQRGEWDADWETSKEDKQ